MAEAKIINTRQAQKRGTAAEWALATNFIPRDGEIIVYKDGKGGEDRTLVKVGDGKTVVSLLPFLSASVYWERID